MTTRRFRLSPASWFALVIVAELAVCQFTASLHNLSRPGLPNDTVHWYGFPFVWMTGPAPLRLLAEPMRGWSNPALLLDLACMAAAGMAVLHFAAWLPQGRRMPLGFTVRGLFAVTTACAVMNAFWIEPERFGCCGELGCTFVVNTELLAHWRYLRLALPAIAFHAFALTAMLEIGIAAAWRLAQRRLAQRLASR